VRRNIRAGVEELARALPTVSFVIPDQNHDMHGLTPPGAAANVGPIAEIWH
jgi:hypothetical protein